MDIESTIETITAYIPEDLGTAIDTVTAFLPDEAALRNAVDQAVSLIPTQLGFLTMTRFLLLFAAGSLLVGVLGRMILGKRSSLNHSLSSVMGILFVYAVTIVIYTFQPQNLSTFLSPLPFVTFSGEYMVILPLQNAQIPIICHEILGMVILAFLVNLLDTLIPKGNSVLGWFVYRFIMIVLAMVLHLLIRWAFDAFLPDLLVTYAPVILLGILVTMLLLGLLNVVLSLVLTVVNPIIGAAYTFFFSTLIGKQLTKAVFTAIILCALFFLLGYFDFTIIRIDISSLTAYIPLAAVSLILWYTIGHVL